MTRPSFLFGGLTQSSQKPTELLFSCQTVFSTQENESLAHYIVAWRFSLHSCAISWATLFTNRCDQFSCSFTLKRGNESFCLNKAFSLIIIPLPPFYPGPDSPKAREDPVRGPSPPPPPPPPPLPVPVRNIEEVMLSHQRAPKQHSLDGEETDNRAVSKSPCITPEPTGPRSACCVGETRILSFYYMQMLTDL